MAINRSADEVLWRVLLYTVLLSGAFISLMPFLYMVGTSLKTFGQTLTRVAPFPWMANFWPELDRIQWVNYVEAWVTASFAQYFFNSLAIATVNVTGTFLSTVLAAFAFAKLNFVGRDVVFSVVLATLMIPDDVKLIPNFLTISNLGLIDTIWALTIPFMGSAFFIFLIRQFFRQVPNDLLESARIDGATHFGMLWRIVVPLSKAPLFTMVFLAFTQAWNDLQWALIVSRSERWRPITVGLTRFINEAAAETHLRMAGTLIAMVPILLVYFAAQRQITDAITRTGLKG
ncbi:MAG: carbohydrate ABC transporter permease [Spirochaetales bacterium]